MEKEGRQTVKIKNMVTAFPGTIARYHREDGTPFEVPVVAWGAWINPDVQADSKDTHERYGAFVFEEEYGFVPTEWLSKLRPELIYHGTVLRPRNSRRVASWLYEVINPMIESLATEICILGRGNATFRTHDLKLERIMGIKESLSHAGRHVLRDLLCAHSEIYDAFRRRDVCVQALEQAACSAYQALVIDAEFLKQINLCKSADQVFEDFSQPFLDSVKPHHLAERVVNSLQSDEMYSGRLEEFWKRYRDTLMRCMKGPALELFRDRLKWLLDEDQKLLEYLEKKAAELCGEWDLPAAPVIGIM